MTLTRHIEKITKNPSFDVKSIRKHFPVLHQQINGYPLVYLDNAASSQKPAFVTEEMKNYYETIHSNVHRGVHHLSRKATEAYENARKKVQQFINAANPNEVIYTRGTTESINLAASSFGKRYINAGDEIIISGMEHHSNIVPWQMVCEEKKAKLRIIPVTDTGELDMAEFEKLLTKKTKIVAVTHVSNGLGTVNPVKIIIDCAHRHNIPVLIDGAQAVAHVKIDVQQMNCDFYAFSSHKMFGPTGIGILYGKEKLLNSLPPYQGGGEMIETVTFEKTTYNELPHKFEAGTPSIAEAIGLGAAIDYINSLGFDNIKVYEDRLIEYAIEQLMRIDGLRIIGNASERTAVISFLIDGIHPYDTGTILDKLGVAVRTGHHCNMPLMSRFNIPGTVRASFAFYNTFEEVDRLVHCIRKSKDMLK